MGLLGRKIAIRWAKALYKLAEEQNLVEEVYQDFMSLKEDIEQSKEFAMFLRSPAISNYKKAKMLEKIFDGKLNKLTYLFISKLAGRGRSEILYDIILEFKEIYYDKHNLLEAKLITAIQIPEELKSLFIQKLTDVYKKKILLDVEVNPEIIGGFQLWVKNYLLDASVVTELKLIHRKFTENLYLKEI